MNSEHERPGVVAPPQRCLWSLPKRLASKLLRSVLKAWLHWRKGTHYVFVYVGSAVEIPVPEGFRVLRCQCMADIPKDCVEQMIGYHGDRFARIMGKEFEDRGVLWLALVNGQFASRQWTRSGAHFRKWFLPLRGDDLVFFGAYTIKAFRGRRINPALKREIMARELHGDGKAYVDTQEWNTASMHALGKVGFKPIGVIRRGRAALSGEAPQERG